MTPKTITINEPSPLVLKKISKPDFMERILSHKWVIIHGPTGMGVAPFRLHKTAKTAAKWLESQIPAAVLASADAAAIKSAGDKAGWIAEYNRLADSEIKQ